jgi:hypothetical protein
MTTTRKSGTDHVFSEQGNGKEKRGLSLISGFGERVRLWDAHPGVAAWYKRVLARPSVKKEILDRMTSDDHAPFKKLHEQPDPWPKVAAIRS